MNLNLSNVCNSQETNGRYHVCVSKLEGYEYKKHEMSAKETKRIYFNFSGVHFACENKLSKSKISE